MKSWMIMVLVFLGGLLIFGCISEQTPNEPMIGNDSDVHGCKASAGYTWCEEKQKCIRPWEENCTLTEELCTNAGGLWDECGSACWGIPNATVCTMQCVQYCHCGGLAGFKCPDGYYCTDYVPENATDAMGICKPN